MIINNGGTIDNTEFTDVVKISFHLTDKNIHKLEQQLADLTRGEREISITDEKFFEVT